MKLNKLMEMQRAGAFKVAENSDVSRAIVGGVPMDDKQCCAVASALGWNGRTSDRGFKMIDKTDKFIRNMRIYIDNEWIINNTVVEFESMRHSGTEKIGDRIKWVSPLYDFSILHAFPGCGGSYAVFDPTVSQAKPIFTCRTLKALGEFLNNQVTE